MCGDSTNSDDVNSLMNKKKANLLLTDPPYGVSYTGNKNNQNWDMIANDDLRGDNLNNFLLVSFKNFFTNSIANAPAYIFYASSTHRQFENAVEMSGMKVRQQLIWAKHLVMGNSDYHWTHEPILYCGKGKDKPIFYGDRTNTTVLNKLEEVEKMSKEQLITIVKGLKELQTIQEIKKDTVNYDHPTQKPIAILTILIKNSSVLGDIVLDLFARSGSTLIAAQQLERKCYCMEFSPAFCDVIRKRYAKFINKEEQWEKITPRIN